MSFCPNADVHSIYLDNEMPGKYVAEYEAHVKNCPECQKKLESLRNVHNLLKTDAESISPEKLFNSENYTDESYKRLMIKMAYSNNVKITKPVKNRFTEAIRYSIPAAVAAAIIAVVMPVRFLVSSSSRNAMQIASAQESVNSRAVEASAYLPELVARTANGTPVSFNRNRGVVISGNIHESVLPMGNANSYAVSNAVSEKQKSQKMGIQGSSLINGYEVFKPAISEDKTISIKITVPGMNAVPVTTEIELPYNVFTGFFE